MPNGTKICKVCGKEYSYCTTIAKDRFRWQDVACCPEHAMEYFKQVEAARSDKPVADSKTTSKKTTLKKTFGTSSEKNEDDIKEDIDKGNEEV